ncbi:hypothetical protein FA15DRAFT_697382 [Coprinopsis marcescibilis]|uniref:Uncharacterized protein n=1 Tax=Coprinopsis marcescibilis TaxID=230819 RepID=A0A5C3KHS6_COPMA|nr:hypothetical protein FA15DRAFT_697382 [Coprinopsis marcescibilis]
MVVAKLPGRLLGTFFDASLLMYDCLHPTEGESWTHPVLSAVAPREPVEVEIGVEVEVCGAVFSTVRKPLRTACGGVYRPFAKLIRQGTARDVEEKRAGEKASRHNSRTATKRKHDDDDDVPGAEAIVVRPRVKALKMEQEQELAEEQEAEMEDEEEPELPEEQQSEMEDEAEVVMSLEGGQLDDDDDDDDDENDVVEWVPAGRRCEHCAKAHKACLKPVRGGEIGYGDERCQLCRHRGYVRCLAKGGVLGGLRTAPASTTIRGGRSPSTTSRQRGRSSAASVAVSGSTPKAVLESSPPATARRTTGTINRANTSRPTKRIAGPASSPPPTIARWLTRSKASAAASSAATTRGASPATAITRGPTMSCDRDGNSPVTTGSQAARTTRSATAVGPGVPSKRTAGGTAVPALRQNAAASSSRARNIAKAPTPATTVASSAQVPNNANPQPSDPFPTDHAPIVTLSSRKGKFIARGTWLEGPDGGYRIGPLPPQAFPSVPELPAGISLTRAAAEQSLLVARHTAHSAPAQQTPSTARFAFGDGGPGSGTDSTSTSRIPDAQPVSDHISAPAPFADQHEVWAAVLVQLHVHNELLRIQGQNIIDIHRGCLWAAKMDVYGVKRRRQEPETEQEQEVVEEREQGMESKQGMEQAQEQAKEAQQDQVEEDEMESEVEAGEGEEVLELEEDDNIVKWVPAAPRCVSGRTKPVGIPESGRELQGMMSGANCVAFGVSSGVRRKRSGERKRARRLPVRLSKDLASSAQHSRREVDYQLGRCKLLCVQRGAREAVTDTSSALDQANRDSRHLQPGYYRLASNHFSPTNDKVLSPRPQRPPLANRQGTLGARPPPHPRIAPGPRQVVFHRTRSHRLIIEELLRVQGQNILDINRYLAQIVRRLPVGD